MKRKRQINWYQANDSEAIAAHLEKMAAKGWFLEKAGNSLWTFRRGEPRAVRYAVTFFPDASVFDGGLTQGQETYIDYCRAAGWEFVTANGPIQYFRSELPDPVPIETDEAEKLQVIRRTMRKTLVLGHALLLLCDAVWLWERWRDFQWSPLESVSSPTWLYSLLFCMAFALYLAGILADYFIWCLRSKRSVAQGGTCAPVHTRARLWCGFIVLALGAAHILPVLPVYLAYPAFSLYVTGGLLAAVAVSQGVMWLLKRRGCERGTVLGGFIVSVIVLSIVYAAGISPLASAAAETSRMDGAAYVYTSERGSQRPVYRDKLPVTLEELGYSVEEEDHCSYQAEEQRSFLASYGRYIQQPVNAKSSLPYLYYTVCHISSDALRDFCWQALSQSPLFPRFPKMKYPAIMEDLPEGALEGRCDAGDHRYALLYPDRIVLYESGWELTEAQLEAVLGVLEE